MNLDITKQLEEKRFFKLYEELYQEPYTKLNNNDRCIYSLLANRMHLSVNHNNFIDDDGIFVKYTQSKLAEDLCISKRTVINSFEKLKEYNLIKVIDLGANLPNKIYVYPPVIINSEKNTPMEVQNLHSYGEKNSIHSAKIAYEKDLYKTELKDIYIEDINANANNKNNNKHKPSYIDSNEWLYDLYIAFNNLKKITNNTDYYWLNKLVDDMQDEDNLIKYYFHKYKNCNGKSKNANYIYQAVISWKGKSIHQIEYEEKQFFKNKQQEQLNAKYEKANSSNYNIPKSDEELHREQQLRQAFKKLSKQVNKRKQQPKEEDVVADVLNDLY